MDIKEVQKLCGKYPGMRYKVEKNGDIIVYANAYTLIIDIFRRIARAVH